MHQYRPGYWGILFAFSLKGSTVLKALAWAVPCTILTVIVNYVFHNYISIPDKLDVKQAWYVYNWSIGFLVAFRTKTAYSRWWEGGGLLQKIRGEWFNGYSSLISFCSDKTDLKEEVRNFQFTLARLTSLLHCSVLLTVCQEDDACCFEILDLKGMPQSSLEYLWKSSDKVEIVNHWIQQLIVKNMRNGVLAIPPPVISRVFQELSRGMVLFNNLLKISEFLLPFPFAQLTTFMLLIHWLLTPFVVGLIFDGLTFAAITSFISVFALWAINYTGTEVEQPFGLDENDLPLYEMQAFLNESIMALLEEKVQAAPKFAKLDIGYRLEAVPTTAYNSEPITLRTRMADIERVRPRSRISINRNSRQSLCTISEKSHDFDMFWSPTLVSEIDLEESPRGYHTTSDHRNHFASNGTLDVSATTVESDRYHDDGVSSGGFSSIRSLPSERTSTKHATIDPHGRARQESIYSLGSTGAKGLYQDADLFCETRRQTQALDWKAHFGEEMVGPFRSPRGPPATVPAKIASTVSTV